MLHIYEKKYLVSILDAAISDVEITALHSIYLWIEMPIIRIHYQLHSDITEDEMEELRCVTTEIMASTSIELVDESFGIEKPDEVIGMLVLIINP